MATLTFNMTMSLDGFVAGPRQSLEDPFGEGGMGLHGWAFATRGFREMHGMEGGETGIDDDIASGWNVNIGATIMGRNMFGPVRGTWGDDSWRGWWGEDPPYHTPVFALTHHAREPVQMRPFRLLRQFAKPPGAPVPAVGITARPDGSSQ